MLAATAWSIGSAYLDRVLRFAVFIVVGRLVAPDQFGVVLISLLVTETLQVFLDAGLSKVLVQQKELSASQIDTAFTFVVAINALASLCFFFGASLVADFAHEERLTLLIRILSVVPVISGVAQIQVALLQRDLDFKKLGTRTILSSLIGSVVALVLATCGQGIFALVGRAIVQTSCGTMLVWIASPYRPRFRIDRGALKTLLPKGFQFWSANVASLINFRGFDVLAGLLVGPAALGVLRIAGQIVMLIVDLTFTPLLSVGLATLARHQNEPALFEKSLVQFAGLASLLILPSFAGLLVVADPILPLMFGSRWTETANITPYMCIIAPALLWQVLFMASCMATGRINRLLACALVEAVLTVLLGLIGSRYGLIGLAAAGSIRLYLIIPMTWHWFKKDTGINPLVLLRSAMPNFLASLGMLSFLLVVKARLYTSVEAPVLAGTLIVLGIIAYVVLLPLVSAAVSQPMVVPLPQSLQVYIRKNKNRVMGAFFGGR